MEMFANPIEAIQYLMIKFGSLFAKGLAIWILVCIVATALVSINPSFVWRHIPCLRVFAITPLRQLYDLQSWSEDKVIQELGPYDYGSFYCGETQPGDYGFSYQVSFTQYLNFQFRKGKIVRTLFCDSH